MFGNMFPKMLSTKGKNKISMLAQNSNNRNSNIELFRFVLMFVICFWYLLVHGVGVKNIGMMDEVTIGV